MILSFVFPSVVSLVATWLIAEYLNDNAPELGASNAWLVGGVMGSAAGAGASYLIDVASAHVQATGALLLLVGACSGAFAAALARPALRARVDVWLGSDEGPPARLRGAPDERPERRLRGSGPQGRPGAPRSRSNS